MEKIKGTISFVLYPRGDSGPVDFRIVEFRVQNDAGQITGTIKARGPIPSGGREDTMELLGNWVDDPKFGRQFDVLAADKLVPETPDELEVYLTREIEGIGPSRAAKIIARFGASTREVLSDTPEKLLAISGINTGLLARIKESWNLATNSAHKSTRMWLIGKGVSPAYAERLIRHFQGNTVDILTNNPYRATEVSRIGFQVADGLAMALGWDKSSPERIEAACVHAMTEASLESGQVFLHIDQILTKVHKCVGSDEKATRAALARSTTQGRLTLDTVSQAGNNLQVVYLPHLYEAETQLAARLAELQRYPHEAHSGLDEALSQVQKRMHQELSPKQIQGIRNAFAYHVSGVTGGPGTGKSTLCQALVQTAELLNLECRLAAPTGRAAKRLSEITGREASTIHRLLEFDPKSYQFNRNAQNPIDAGLLIVDESSMLDLTLAYNLFQAVPDCCSVLIIGDADQLPSVGAGTVLKDLIESRTIHFTVLDSIFRQAEGSDIVRNAHRIKNGDTPQFMPKGIETDCYLMPIPSIKIEGKSVDDVEYVKKALERLCKTDIPGKMPVDPIRDIQVIIPMKVGAAGTRVINKTLQDSLNPLGGKIPGTDFRIGDRVMQFVNNYKQDVFNGDIGFIDQFDPETGNLWVDFYGRRVEYTRKEMEELNLAFAQTIHKCVAGNERIPVIGRGWIKASQVKRGNLTPYGPLLGVYESSRYRWKIITERGFEIVCSGEHRWCTLNGLKATAELRPGKDRIELATVPSFSGDNKIDSETAWFLGALVGDGCYTDRREGQLHFACTTRSIGERYRKFLHNRQLLCNWRKDKRGLHSTSKPFRKELEKMGLGYVKSPMKRIPEAIWQAGPSAWPSFLQGLFDTDGSVGRSHLVYCTRAEQLGKDIQLMLLGMGIVVKRTPFRVGKEGKGGLYWQLWITGAGIGKYRAKIGFSHPERAKKLKALKPNRSILRFDGYDTISQVERLDDTGGIKMYDVEIPAPHVLSFSGFMGHNSQGSEYPIVIVVLMTQHFIMLERNLLYTATTRARRMCLYLASQRALGIACHRDSTAGRNSMLTYRLRVEHSAGN